MRDGMTIVQSWEQALALLNNSAEKIVTEPWTCGSCGEEIEAGFDACWKCGASCRTDLPT